MNRFMRHLSRRSFNQSFPSDSYHSTDTSQTDSMITDSESSSIEDSQPPQIPPPPPPNPPPRRRRKQRSVFYSSTPSLHSPEVEVPAVKPKRPSVPPPIPPRSVSISGESPQKCWADESMRPYSETNIIFSDDNMFSKEELIDNLTQNLSVMEDLNESLRNQLKECREENTILVNELAAIRIERNQLLQTCKEIETLKDNEWVCSICLDDRQFIVSTDRTIVATFCGHLFCNICFDMALGLESVCPTCRKPMPNHQKRLPYLNLYF